MAKGNKAHTATVNRIAQRYGVEANLGDGPDIRADGTTIEVETTATIEAAIERLRNWPTTIYIAVTNKEGLREAMQLTAGTKIGVMDPQGEIVRPFGESET